MRTRRSIGYLCARTVFSIMLAGMTWPAVADVTGIIQGTVTDASGAVLPKAALTLRNPETGLVKTAHTDGHGFYEFIAVPVGKGYLVSVEVPGFKTVTHSDVLLLINQIYTSDFTLAVGSTSADITVSTDAVQIEQASTQVGDVIDAKKMTDMPLNGRSYVDLLALQPGVVPINSGASGTSTVSGDLSSGNLSVNGAREDANAYLVNGADVEENVRNGASVIPSLDSIQEFRVLTDTFDAEYGHFAGGIVNVVTKSGTNRFHGTAYEFLRNSALDARNYFNTAGPKGSLKQNQFGAAAGGPVVKDRLFFFSDYQGTRLESGATTPLLHVPTTQEMSGDFSDVTTVGYNPITGMVRGGPGSNSMNAVLSQRLGYTVSSGEPYWVQGCNTLADAQSGMCVFPGAAIPQKAWSTAATGMLQYIPKQNGTNGNIPTFTTSENNQVIQDDKIGERVDWRTSHLGSWVAYYFLDKASVTNPYPESNVPGFGSQTPTKVQNASLSNELTIGSSAVNEAQISFTRLANGGGTPTGGVGSGTLGKIGFQTTGNGIVPPAKYEGVPQIALSQLGLDFGMYDNTMHQNENTYAISDSFSKLLGQHSIKLGGQFRLFQINSLLTYSENGDFSFQGGETGNDFADYLLGAPDQFIQASPGALDSRSKYAGIYAQDSYKARPNLTINYGIRWDMTSPWSDTQNRLQTINWGQQSTRFPGAPTGLNFPGDAGVPPTLSPIRYRDFAPRFGVAYVPNFGEGALGKILGGPGKTSIRAGFGIFYTAYGQATNGQELGNPPFAIYFQSPVPDYLEAPYNGRQGQNPGQRFPYAPPTSGSSVDWSTFLPFGSASVFVKSNVTPYTEQYNFNVQRQLGNSTIVTLAYVGTSGRHLLALADLNPGVASTCLAIPGCGPFGEDTIYDVNGKSYAGTRPHSVTSGRLLSQGQLDFTTVPEIATFVSSTYNAFQASVQKVVGQLQILGSYSWSNSMDNLSGTSNHAVWVNPFNHSATRGLSAFNMKHNLVVSYAYSIPSYSRKTRLTGGWQVSGITRLTTGFPILLTESGDRSLCNCFEGGEPDYNGGSIQKFDPRHAGNAYFSSTPFSAEPLGQFGTARHYFFSGPGLNQTDFALRKLTRVTEGTSLEFRAEMFNVFNHVQFLNPSGDYGSLSSFGVVSGARDPRIGQGALKFVF
jgi:Carboxypeptidase regulatory-like domain/TonB-dependent Receptor Plug Domain